MGRGELEDAQKKVRQNYKSNVSLAYINSWHKFVLRHTIYGWNLNSLLFWQLTNLDREVCGGAWEGMMAGVMKKNRIKKIKTAVFPLKMVP